MQTILWDWNGTLLDDLELSIDCINRILTERNLRPLTIESYREAFTFPVLDYYKSIGLDFEKEDFATLAAQFIKCYTGKVASCQLKYPAEELLNRFKATGKRQMILSAMHEELLQTTLKQQNIMHYFDAIAGLKDHYAASKVERGKQLVQEYQLNTGNTVLIGDTLHDYEVARVIGVDCILVADGHQSEQRLRASGAKVISSLAELNTVFQEQP